MRFFVLILISGIVIPASCHEGRERTHDRINWAEYTAASSRMRLGTLLRAPKLVKCELVSEVIGAG